MSGAIKRVLVTGGAGYVGSVLVPKLLAAGYQVTVLDLYIYGEEVLAAVKGDPNLKEIKGDLRDQSLLRRILTGCDAVIHLACISNDPSFELDPQLGRSINFDAFGPLVELSKAAGVKRFIYASSSSVYGVKSESQVTEELSLEPLTDYSKYKALCEEVLREKRAPGFTTLILRPATVCGWSPRLRLDLTVNIMTAHALCHGKIKVFGGAQARPNFHIEDMTDLYVQTLTYPEAAIDGKTYNAGYQNHSVAEIAEIVRSVVGPGISVETTPAEDNRSYRISSEKIRQDLGFIPKHTIEEAVADLVRAFHAGLMPDALSEARYSNIRTMQAINLA